MNFDMSETNQNQSGVVQSFALHPGEVHSELLVPDRRLQYASWSKFYHHFVPMILMVIGLTGDLPFL